MHSRGSLPEAARINLLYFYQIFVSAEIIFQTEQPAAEPTE
jgi:hypothetical protein